MSEFDNIIEAKYNEFKVNNKFYSKKLDEIKEKYGFEANAIVTMKEVVDYLYNKPYKGQTYIDDEIKAAIDKYYETYGV